MKNGGSLQNPAELAQSFMNNPSSSNLGFNNFPNLQNPQGTKSQLYQNVQFNPSPQNNAAGVPQPSPFANPFMNMPNFQNTMYENMFRAQLKEL